MTSTITIPSLPSLAHTIPEKTRTALAEASLIASGVIGSRRNTPVGQWDKLAYFVCQMRDLRPLESFHGQLDIKAPAWAVYVRLLNGFLVDPDLVN